MKTIIVCAVALSFLGAQASLGQVPKVPPKITDWRMDTINKNGNASCAIAATIIDGENFKQYVLGYIAASSTFAISNSGGNFKQAGIKVDNAAPVPFKCVGGTCWPASDALQGQLLDQLRRGKTAIVALQTMDGKTAGPFAVPLDRFPAEWDRLLACGKK